MFNIVKRFCRLSSLKCLMPPPLILPVWNGWGPHNPPKASAPQPPSWALFPQWPGISTSSGRTIFWNASATKTYSPLNSNAWRVRWKLVAAFHNLPMWMELDVEGISTYSPTMKRRKSEESRVVGSRPYLSSKKIPTTSWEHEAPLKNTHFI